MFFFGKGGGASQWKVCYQRVLHRLVLFLPEAKNLTAISPICPPAK